MSAQYAPVRHDDRPLILDLDGLYIAVADAFVAVLALCGFEINDFHAHNQSLPFISFSKNSSVSSGFNE